MALFDCHFKGGRAATAPQTRTGASSKKTIAEAESGVHNMEEKGRETAQSSSEVAGHDPVPYQDEESEGIVEESHDEEDTDMGVVDEDESEEEMVGVIHEDAEDAVSSILLNQLGQAGRSHRREFSQNYRKLVSEIYSPPRVTEEIKKGRYRKLAPGFAFDLTIVDPDDGQPLGFQPSRQARESTANASGTEAHPPDRVANVHPVLHLAVSQLQQEFR